VLAPSEARSDDTGHADVTPPTKVLITSSTTKRLGGELARTPAASADGRYIAYAEQGPASDAVGLFVWDRLFNIRVRIADDVGGVSPPSISADGRFVSYSNQRWRENDSGKRVPIDDVYTWDRVTGTTTLISAANTYAMTHGDDFTASTDMSADGQFIIYHSDATNDLVTDLNGGEDLFLWDRSTGTTTRLTNGNGYSYSPSISADGNVVAFASEATNLVPGPRNGGDVFLLDRTSGSVSRVTAGNDYSVDPQISADGRHVTFTSVASNLVPGDNNGQLDVFVWDRTTGLTSRLTNGSGFSTDSTISADGRYVSFQSEATDLVPGDTNRVTDVFVADRAAGTLERITNGNGPSVEPSMSDDGLHIMYHSQASNLVTRDRRAWGAFLWDQAR
jgi:Tol biopolymer transport system component